MTSYFCAVRSYGTEEDSVAELMAAVVCEAQESGVTDAQAVSHGLPTTRGRERSVLVTIESHIPHAHDHEGWHVIATHAEKGCRS